MLLRVLEARERGPHRRHFERVRRDVLALDLLPVEVLLVDADLFGELRDVGDVDLDRAVAQGLHELVVQELLVLGLVGVADDDLVDVRLRGSSTTATCSRPSTSSTTRASRPNPSSSRSATTRGCLAKSSSCPGVRIGDYAVIGTGSVVTGDIPDYAVAAGNPARVIKERAQVDYRYVPADVSREAMETWLAKREAGG